MIRVHLRFLLMKLLLHNLQENVLAFEMYVFNKYCECVSMRLSDETLEYKLLHRTTHDFTEI